jgi:hypothetical protein
MNFARNQTGQESTFRELRRKSYDVNDLPWYLSVRTEHWVPHNWTRFAEQGTQ